MSNIYIIIAAAVIALTSFSGALLTAKVFRNNLYKNQALLVSFAAGVFIIAGGGVVLEALELAGSVEVILYFFGAVIVLHALSIIWPEHHYHHEGDHCHDCRPRQGTARRVLIGDSVHNIVDGMLLVPAFFVGVEFGLFTVFAIWLHEIVQEVSEFIILKNSGYSTRKALRLNALSALTIFIGVGVALVATELVHDLEGPLLAIAGGSFLYIALKDLIPHSVRHGHAHKKYQAHILAFLIGLVLMLGTGQLSGHSHGVDHNLHGEHGEHGEHHEH